MRPLIFLLALLMPCGALAQQEPVARARAAMDLLDGAADQLEQAQSARDRVRALTRTVGALEEGLGALRAGLLQVSQAQEALAKELSQHDGEVAELLAVLMRIGDEPSPAAMMHPAGPTGSLRAGMLVADTVPALDARAAQLREDVQQLTALRALQSQARDRLEAGLLEVQQARSELNEAIAERTDLPKRFVNDPVREAILIASADTLEQFAAGLDQVTADLVAQAPPRLDGVKGDLPLPVHGRLLRDAGEVDAAGIRRPGVILAVPPQAIVTSPVAATIRYAGPLLDFGQVVILEPQADVLFVLAGLETIYGAAGDVVDAGAPLGLMGRIDHKNVAELSTDGDVTGAERTETIYIEVRQDNIPEDPNLWFRMDKDG